jgi:xylulose-5-phosphate/fructose-6-phosphate phosphoketolase
MYEGANEFINFCRAKLGEHYTYICENLDDMPEVKNWKWNSVELENVTTL